MTSDAVRLPNPLWTRLADGDERYVVTGATGWLGRSCIDVLASAVGLDRIFGYASGDSTITTADGQHFPIQGLPALADLAAGPPTVILHAAYLTRGHVQHLGEQSFADTNRKITDSVLQAVRRLLPLGLVYPSSGAATHHPETAYGRLKGEDEETFSRACSEGGSSLATVRIYAMSGPRMTQRNSYALGDLITQARAGGDLRVRAQHPVVRSYVAAEEVCSVGLACVLADQTVLVETGGIDVEVGQLAESVARLLGRQGARVLRSWDASGPTDAYVADPSGWLALTAQHGLVPLGLEAQISWTATGWDPPPATR